MTNKNCFINCDHIEICFPYVNQFTISRRYSVTEHGHSTSFYRLLLVRMYPLIIALATREGNSCYILWNIIWKLWCATALSHKKNRGILNVVPTVPIHLKSTNPQDWTSQMSGWIQTLLANSSVCNFGNHWKQMRKDHVKNMQYVCF